MKLLGYLLGALLLLNAFLQIHTCNKCALNDHTKNDTIATYSQKEFDSLTRKVVLDTKNSAISIITGKIPIINIKVDTQAILSSLIVDTNAIVAKWIDTYKIRYQEYRDSSLWLLITDSIYQNDIKAREIEYKILRPVEVSNNTIIKANSKQKAVIYSGINSGYTRGPNLSPVLLFSNKRGNNMYSLQSNVLENQPNFMLGIMVKIR
jgi:hypothetical protein